MRTAIIVDDEFSCIEILKFELKRLEAKIKIIGTCSDPRNATQLIDELRPDIVFLDIEMPWMSGFELLDSLDGKINFQVVFVTAFDQYAIKAFKYFALDYILKPVEKKALASTLEHLALRNSKDKKNFQDLAQFLNSRENRNARIAFPTQEGYEVYDYDEIVRCAADSNYTKIYLTDHRMLMLAKTLKEIDNMLEDDRFIRVHQSHLINYDYVRKYHKHDGTYLVMKDQTQIPVARTKKSGILSRLK